MSDDATPLDTTQLPVTLESLLAEADGPGSDADVEAHIIEVFRAADTDGLNALLDEADDEVVDRLFSEVDNRLFGPDHRTELITLLTLDRLVELRTPALAAIIYAMQSGRTSGEMEKAIERIFVSRGGRDLLALKNEINNRTDQHDLEGLLFVDIDDEGVRDRILDHFATHATALQEDGFAEVKVRSDIDDTAVARIHESRYPRGTVYPGVLAVYEALDQGPHNTPESTGDLTFVTARPMDAFGLIENHSRSSLRKAGIANLSVLSGSFFNLHTHDAMAAKKLVNIDHYHRLYPEYGLVFLGDSGQGDIAVGEQMYADHGGAVRAVVIHDVRAMNDEERAAYEAKGIYLVDTYVGAGVRLHQLGLISAASLQRVIDETTSLADKVEWRDDGQRDAMWELWRRDIAAAGEHLATVAPLERQEPPS